MKNGNDATASATAERADRRRVGALRIVSIVREFAATCFELGARSRCMVGLQKAQRQRRERIAQLACAASVLADEALETGRLEQERAEELSCLASCLDSNLAHPIFLDCSDDFNDRDVDALTEFVRFLEAVLDEEIDDPLAVAIKPEVQVLGDYLYRDRRKIESGSSS